MPSHVPRTDTLKKEVQLGKREQELEHAIRHGFTRELLTRAVERVRTAHLSLLKARRHWAGNVRDRDAAARLRNIERETENWKLRSVDEILKSHTK